MPQGGRIVIETRDAELHEDQAQYKPVVVMAPM